MRTRGMEASPPLTVYTDEKGWERVAARCGHGGWCAFIVQFGKRKGSEGPGHARNCMNPVSSYLDSSY